LGLGLGWGGVSDIDGNGGILSSNCSCFFTTPILENRNTPTNPEPALNNAPPMRAPMRAQVFIPLTRLCRDACGYCTFAQPPARGRRAYMTLEEVLSVARLGAAQGCCEALFTLGAHSFFGGGRVAFGSIGWWGGSRLILDASGCFWVDRLVPSGR